VLCHWYICTSATNRNRKQYYYTKLLFIARSDKVAFLCFVNFPRCVFHHLSRLTKLSKWRKFLRKSKDSTDPFHNGSDWELITPSGQYRCNIELCMCKLSSTIWVQRGVFTVSDFFSFAVWQHILFKLFFPICRSQCLHYPLHESWWLNFWLCPTFKLMFQHVNRYNAKRRHWRRTKLGI